MQKGVHSRGPAFCLICSRPPSLAGDRKSFSVSSATTADWRLVAEEGHLGTHTDRLATSDRRTTSFARTKDTLFLANKFSWPAWTPRTQNIPEKQRWGWGKLGKSQEREKLSSLKEKLLSVSRSNACPASTTTNHSCDLNPTKYRSVKGDGTCLAYAGGSSFPVRP